MIDGHTLVASNVLIIIGLLFISGSNAYELIHGPLNEKMVTTVTSSNLVAVFAVVSGHMIRYVEEKRLKMMQIEENKKPKINYIL